MFLNLFSLVFYPKYDIFHKKNLPHFARDFSLK